MTQFGLYFQKQSHHNYEIAINFTNRFQIWRHSNVHAQNLWLPFSPSRAHENHQPASWRPSVLLTYPLLEPYYPSLRANFSLIIVQFNGNTFTKQDSEQHAR